MPYSIKDTPYEFPFLEEITLDQFVALGHCKTDLDKLQLLMGDISEISQRPNAMQFLSAFNGLLNGLEKEISGFLKKPNRVEQQSKLTIMATEINPATINRTENDFWQQQKIKSIITGMGEEPFNAYSHYKNFIGHSTYSIVTKWVYDEAKAQEYTEDVIGDLPFIDAMRIGDYLLYVQRDLWMSKKLDRKISYKMKEDWVKTKFSNHNEN